MHRRMAWLGCLLLTGLSGCSTQSVLLDLWLLVPTDDVVKQVDDGRPLVGIASDRLIDPPRDRIVFQRGKTRTVQVAVGNRPPKYGSSYMGKVEVTFEPPPGIVVRPDRLTIDLTEDSPAPGATSGGTREVSLEVAADAQPGKIKMAVRTTEHPTLNDTYKYTAEFSFAVR